MRDAFYVVESVDADHDFFGDIFGLEGAEAGEDGWGGEGGGEMRRVDADGVGRDCYCAGVVGYGGGCCVEVAGRCVSNVFGVEDKGKGKKGHGYIQEDPAAGEEMAGVVAGVKADHVGLEDALEDVEANR